VNPKKLGVSHDTIKAIMTVTKQQQKIEKVKQQTTHEDYRQTVWIALFCCLADLKKISSINILICTP